MAIWCGGILYHITVDIITLPESPTIGNKIKYYRQIRHMLGEEVADLAGVSRHAFMSYEADETEPRLEDLQQMAAVLEIEADKLYDEYYAFLAFPYSALIKQIRKEKKLLQRDFGCLLNVHQGTVKRWESGGISVTREVWQKMKDIGILVSTAK